MTLTSTVTIPSLTQDPLTITMGISTGLGFKGIYRQQNRLATCAKFCQSLVLSFKANCPLMISKLLHYTYRQRTICYF